MYMMKFHFRKKKEANPVTKENSELNIFCDSMCMEKKKKKCLKRKQNKIMLILIRYLFLRFPY